MENDKKSNPGISEVAFFIAVCPQAGVSVMSRAVAKNDNFP